MTNQAINCPIRRVTGGPKHHFFGYYDKCPWDKTSRFLLGLEVDFNDRLPTPEDRATVGVVDLLEGSGKFDDVAETRAWNWQQGAMLQWLDSGNGRAIIYNDREGSKLVSVVYDLDTGKRRTMPLPLYAVSRDGTRALAVSFARLHRYRRGYGYAGAMGPWVDRPAPSEDGIHLVDLASGAHRLILSYEAITRFQHHPMMDGATHWVEHLTFNETGRRFLFLHRFNLPDGGHYTRLLTANTDGTEPYLVHEGMVSHLCWKDATRILAWARPRVLLSRGRASRWFSGSVAAALRRWFRHRRPGGLRGRLLGDGFFLFRDRSTERRRIAPRLLTEDGHCSFQPKGDWLVVDTYPDEASQQRLVLYHMKRMKGIDIGRFHTPLAESPIRCDLHPRWSRDGTKVCIDSLHDGTRQIYVVDLRHVLAGGA